MTLEELEELFDELKEEGYEEKDILGILYMMYADGKMPLEDLRTMTELLGYEFTDEFEAMSEEEKKKNGLKKKKNGLKKKKNGLKRIEMENADVDKEEDKSA